MKSCLLQVWYDGTFKYYRRDYRPLTAVYPTFSFNPLTEIHDYYIGTFFKYESAAQDNYYIRVAR